MNKKENHSSKENVNFLKTVGSLLSVFIVGLAVLIFATMLINKHKKPDVIEKFIMQPDCPYSYGAYQELIKSGQYIDLLENKPSYASHGKFGDKDYKIIINRIGEIACGYVYVRAKIDNHPLDEKYESIYLNPQNLGGHLLRSRAIPIPTPNIKMTEILLPLNAIPYLSHVPYNPAASNFEVSDWVKLLNVTNQITFHIALSTENTAGIIDDVKIVYKCWNSKTGEETHDCKLSK